MARLIAYPSDISNIQELRDVFNSEDAPIITRAKGPMVDLLKDSGFKDIENIYGSPTVLLPIEFSVPETLPSRIDKHIRQMSENDLAEVEELFKNEYSLRYRMVRMMYHNCPEACFVYEDKRKIVGVTFNKVEGDETLYMRQIFVREGLRGKGIGRSIYNSILKFARDLGIESANGNIRKETRFLHDRYSPEISLDEKQYYLIAGD